VRRSLWLPAVSNSPRSGQILLKGLQRQKEPFAARRDAARENPNAHILFMVEHAAALPKSKSVSLPGLWRCRSKGLS
jgi:hypothetical protein